MASERPRVALGLWLAALALSAWQLTRAPVVADLSAFLPPSATPAQQLLLEQLKSGVGSRVMLIALGGAPEEALAGTSRTLAAALHKSGLFGTVQNGDFEGMRADREAFLQYRYALSPLAAERFSAAGLRAALESALADLATQSGAAMRGLLPRDPTGELRRIVEGLQVKGPAQRAGVWFSADGKRALLFAETFAGGFDATAQEKAIGAVRTALPADVQAEISGAGVFAAAARASIERDAWLLSTVAATLVLVLLLGVYRRARTVALCFVPVASGLLVGVAAVGLVFGNVHAITLGFGATLIGEAVDYPSYAFLHAGPGENLKSALVRIWPTLRLAVLTTVLGGLTMLLSSFAGLAQLGLLSMTGVLVAGAVTRYVLPSLSGSGAVTERSFSPPFSIDWAPRLAPLVWVLAAGAVALVLLSKTPWEDDLSAMNPVPERLKAADRDLRRELGAPDVRHLLLVRAPSREAALERAESLEPRLRAFTKSGAIGGYDLVTRYLPSRREQERRLKAIPDASTLKMNLQRAQASLPFKPGVFEPFLRDAEEARKRGPLDAADLKGSAIALKVQTLLVPSGNDWAVLVPLTGVTDAAAVARELPLLDLKGESETLLAGYRLEALRLTALGAAAIVLVLWLGLRRVRAVALVVAPVLLALVLTAALLIATGQRLTVFHLIAMLLVMGIGLNYSLFFGRAEEDAAVRGRTLLSLYVNSATTVIAFAALAFSSNPVLHAIGLTVSVGAILALFASATLARK